MKKIFIYCILVFTSLSLSGCGILLNRDKGDQVPAVPDSKTTVNFDSSLLEDCPQLPIPESATDTDLQAFTAKVLNAYVSCATLKSGENSEIKKALNIQ